MKTIELTSDAPTLHELVKLADRENVIIRTAQGRQFLLAELDDFELEVERLKNSEEFMAFLDERSKERGTTSIEELRKELGIAE
ncbi:MAG: hypothetical protein ACREBD_01120 [Blastocatellia bacterium]